MPQPHKFSPLASSRHNLLKPTLFLMLGISLLLGFRFYLMLYFPGTAQTLPLFKLVYPHWEWFSQVVTALKSPLVMVCQILFPKLPAQSGFPEMPAAKLMAMLTHQPVGMYLIAFPGKAEWLTLLAIPFWNILLAGAYLGMKYLMGDASTPSVWHQSRELLTDYLDRQAMRRKPIASPLPRIEKRNQTRQEPTPSPSAPASEQTQARLSQTRNMDLNMPQVQRHTQQDWDNYKFQEGELMVRDMVRQLQRENANLQAQQQQLKSTFSQYFSPQVAQYLESNKGSFENIENQRHIITVLFCDIRGFSNYSQSASSDELVKFLSEYFDIASYYILHKYNGIVSKLMGDGLMAYWGFPVPNDDHAFIATAAALDIMKEVAFRNHTKPQATPLQIGIGIATGEAIVGNIGSVDFKDFTLIGTPVNMASRLEEANKRLNTSLLVSEATYKALKGRIPCHDYGKIPIRGWQAPEHVYAPIIKPPDR